MTKVRRCGGFSGLGFGLKTNVQRGEGANGRPELPSFLSASLLTASRRLPSPVRPFAHSPLPSLALQQLLSVAAGGVGDLGPRQHSSNFFYTSSRIKLVNFYDSLFPRLMLFNCVMGGCKPRYLGLVGYAQYLVGFRKTLELRSDRIAHSAADSRIDLVKDNRSRKLGGACNRLEHQHQSRCLTSRRNSCKRLCRLSLVG